jgi:quinol-cytochrome oxidoreductase complex cytochrome b subunit/coenzyme F420-reducing hydrogenase delta subunit
MYNQLRIGWLRVENAFNGPFGQALNPWYHLGAIAFFLFWVVIVSGIYLYIFFRTGVQQAYDSVEYLTHAQRFYGGVMRSMHRYASDGMVATMLLHMVRNFATGRFRNFRWFSWVTGVLLIWLVYACGINGYWLVWDKLAQFIAVATTEWFGWLPLFSEPLARNFLLQGDVSDRFFTLLSFAHITLPLVLLLIMWIHTKRINSAETSPPRLLAVGTLLMLIALSLFKPASSQGHADLAHSLNTIQLDWFFLAPYPVLYAGSAGALWLLVTVVTAVLLSVPWLFRRPSQLPVEVHLDNCNGCGRCFDDCPYSAIVMQPRQDGRPYELQPVVDANLCASCGICVGSCPFSMPFRSTELVSGLELPELPTAVLRAQTDRALAALHANGPRLVVFGCDRGFGVHAMRSKSVATVSLPCIGMLPPAFIDYALRDSLADGVLVTGCREGDCHFRLGIQWIEQRLARERPPHLRQRVAEERIELCWADAPDRQLLIAGLSKLRERIAALPRDPGSEMAANGGRVKKPR